jgi:hypothetical protein
MFSFHAIDLRKKVHPAQDCAEAYQPQTPKGEYILHVFKILTFSLKRNKFQAYVGCTPL